MKNKRILEIAYFGESNWVRLILKELNDEMRKKYVSSDLRDWGISISTKLDMASLLIHNINNKVSKIRKELKENIKEVDECINKNLAYVVKDERGIFLLLAYTEATIFTVKATYDLLIKYTTHFVRDFLNQGMKESKFLKKCEEKGLNKNWVALLDNVRNDLIHNYSAWISFEKVNGDFVLMIEMPELKNISFKKYREKYLSRQSVNDLFGGFSKFLEITRNFLIEEIRKNK